MKHFLQKALEDAGYSPYSYSGRGMYGKECLGVNIDTGLGLFIGDVLEALYYSDEGAGDHLIEVAEAFRYMQTDNMGRGTVVYFSTIDFDDE